MATVKLDVAQRKRLGDLLAARVGLTTPQRETVLEEMGLDAFRAALHFDADAATFAAQLVRELQARGTLEETGQPALVSLLRWLREEVAGHEADAAFVDDLLLPYQKVGDPTRPLKLFVSYRRRSWAFTGRLAEELQRRLNAEIFVDYSSVDATDFERSILGHLRASDGVLLVVSEHTFSERIREPGDWVRREIELALLLGKPIVLVGVDGLLPPSADALPPSLQAVTRMQSIFFYPEYWDAAVERLADFLTKVTTAEMSPSVDEPPTSPPAGGVAELLSSTPPSPWETLREAQELLEAGDFEKGIFLIETLHDSGFQPKFPKLGRLLADAISHRDAVLKAQQAREEYEQIALLASGDPELAPVREAWVAFRAAYPDFSDDPADLADKLKETAAPPIDSASTPTSEQEHLRATRTQQALLNVMLNPKRPPQERAETGRKLAAIGDPRPGVGLRPDGVPDIAWARMEAGTFPIGGDDGANYPLKGHQVSIAAFSIAKYPVTNAQWDAFANADDGYKNERWWRDSGIPVQEKQEQVLPRWNYSNHPRETVNWYEALAFCRWLSARLGYEVRLPNEREWERTARGAEGRIYPWGTEYVSGYANIDETVEGFGKNKVGSHRLAQTSAVGIYVHGATPEGVLDLSGNLWEWTTSFSDLSNVDVTSSRIVRGGSWGADSLDARATSRGGPNPDSRFAHVGFRVVTTGPMAFREQKASSKATAKPELPMTKLQSKTLHEREPFRPTPGQQALLDVMLDSERPSPQRAEAGRKLAAIGDPRPGVGVRPDGMPDIVWVPLDAGIFPIGGDEGAYKPLESEKAHLHAFSIAKYPVTNAQWNAFLKAPYGYGNNEWWRKIGIAPQDSREPRWSYDNHPRESVNWYEALAFCHWLTAQLGYDVRLPTEQQWERAARGKEGRSYAWGPEYVSGYANIDETTHFGGENASRYFLGSTSAVGIYPQGSTPEGICDLSGNVLEWTSSFYHPSNVDITAPRVLRGGSWGRDSRYARAASLRRGYPRDRGPYVGFRVVALVPAML